MHVLLSNDDGYHAEGLQCLVRTLERARPSWRLSVAAPATEQSASSHSLTLTEPLRVVQHGEGRYSITGTPTDCVLLALNTLFAENPPDAVVSGINHGPNVGEDVHYSGTVAAAFEGRILGRPAIALSLADRSLDFRAAEVFVAQTLPRWLEEGRADGGLLNVNIPSGDPAAVRGIRPCRLGSRLYTDVVVRKEDPHGRPYYWIAGTPQSVDGADDTDLVLSRQGWITVTPLQVDVTHHEELRRWREEFDAR